MRQVLSFVILTFVISGLEQYGIAVHGGERTYLRVFLLMWTPGLMAILCALFFDKNLQSLQMKRPSMRVFSLAYLIPAAVSLGVLLLSVFIAVVDWTPWGVESPWRDFFKKDDLSMVLSVFAASTLGVFIASLSALGEELGWRGFLQTRLDVIAPKYKYILIGLIWSLWHGPLIYLTDYLNTPKTWLSALFFTVSLVSLSVIMGHLTERSRSVLPAALLHGVHNMFFVIMTPAFVKQGPLAYYFFGEAGLLCAMIYLIIAIFISRYSQRIQHQA